MGLLFPVHHFGCVMYRFLLCFICTGDMCGLTHTGVLTGHSLSSGDKGREKQEVLV